MITHNQNAPRGHLEIGPEKVVQRIDATAHNLPWRMLGQLRVIYYVYIVKINANAATGKGLSQIDRGGEVGWCHVAADELRLADLGRELHQLDVAPSRPNTTEDDTCIPNDVLLDGLRFVRPCLPSAVPKASPTVWVSTSQWRTCRVTCLTI